MARLREILKSAEQWGSRAGATAAAWYFDSTQPRREDYLRVIKGIEDGDPEIMSTLPSDPLSGEMSEDLTPAALYAYIGMNNQQIELAGDEVCTAYEDAFSRAAQETILNNCREMLRWTVTFVIDADVDTQDLGKMLSDLEEVIGKHNASLNESRVMDEIGEEITY